MADEDVLAGKVKQVEGKVQYAWGDLTGNPKDDLEGKAKQVEGKIQEGIGHADNAAREQVAAEETAAGVR